MSKAIAINGSPRMEKGTTAMVLAPFIEGITDAGGEVELFYTSRLKIKPCDCGYMHCWTKVPGECYHKDDMELVYPKLKEADILILAAPVYVPLPGGMQDFLNRLCPILNPLLETREGRTRARFRDGVRIKKIALVSTGGWWEKENMDTVVRITQELAEDASVEFSGALLRPHAFMLKKDDQVTEAGESVLKAARRAGHDLIEKGAMSKETLDAVSVPLIGEDELRDAFNRTP